MTNPKYGFFCGYERESSGRVQSRERKQWAEHGGRLDSAMRDAGREAYELEKYRVEVGKKSQVTFDTEEARPECTIGPKGWDLTEASCDVSEA